MPCIATNKTLALRARTKIVATIGPNSSSIATMAKMLEEGMTVARFNMSHGTHESHSELVANAHKASQKAKRPLALLFDLQGPKIRTGELAEQQVTLNAGATLILTTQAIVGSAQKMSVSYKKLPKEVSVGDLILLDDGKVELEISKISGDEIHTKVVVGGTIRSRRGVNVPGANLSIPTISAKDKKDVEFACAQGADFITLSFVRSAKDVHDLRKLIQKTGSNAHIVAKIETEQAVADLQHIIDASDALMIARGDLALEVPRESVPTVQKEAIRKANRAGKPVITATQMLDSMRINLHPTRAEVNDVANAILDGTDAVMLSDETAIGAHPHLAIEAMRKIAHRIENCETFLRERYKWDFEPTRKVESLSKAIVATARTINAKAIVAFSESGYTGRMVARYRPTRPILVITPNEHTFAQSLLIYGCEPELVPRVTRLRDAYRIMRKVLTARKAAQKGDMVVMGAGLPLGTPGETNMMLVEEV